MTGHHASHLNWRKSTRSGGTDDNSSCVEIAPLDNRSIAARDSRDPDGPVLCFTPAEWTAFLTEIKQSAVQ